MHALCCCLFNNMTHLYHWIFCSAARSPALDRYPFDTIEALGLCNLEHWIRFVADSICISIGNQLSVVVIRLVRTIRLNRCGPRCLRTGTVSRVFRAALPADHNLAIMDHV